MIKKFLKWLFRKQWDEFCAEQRMHQRSRWDEYQQEIKGRGRIIGILLRKLGGSVRVYPADMLGYNDDVIIEAVSHPEDGSTTYKLKK